MGADSTRNKDPEDHLEGIDPDNEGGQDGPSRAHPGDDNTFLPDSGMRPPRMTDVNTPPAREVFHPTVMEIAVK